MATATYIPIATQTLGSAASSITFSSIPNTYTDLRLVLICTTVGAADDPSVQFNGDTSTSYSRTYVYGFGSSASTSKSTNTSLIPLDCYSTSTTIPKFYSLDIFSYGGSANKTILTQSAEDENGAGGVSSGVGLWRNTAAITSVKLFLTGSNFSTGTIATLWGI